MTLRECAQNGNAASTWQDDHLGTFANYIYLLQTSQAGMAAHGPVIALCGNSERLTGASCNCLKSLRLGSWTKYTSASRISTPCIYGVYLRHRRRLHSESTVRAAPLSAERRLSTILAKGETILKSQHAPSEACVQEALQECEGFAALLKKATESSTNRPSKVVKNDVYSPASTLLSLDETQKDHAPPSPSTALLAVSIRDNAADKVSKLAYDIMTSPQVFISPRDLETYVKTQSLLGRPDTLPQILQLYATKLVPVPNSSPLRLRKPNPNKVSAAIPLPVANMALTAAIETKRLPICLDIIKLSVCTTAYRRSQMLRRALFPMTVLAAAPVAVYILASKLSVYQNTMDDTTATNILFTGMLAYVGFTATIGIVAVTTANDQMDRVTWVTGMPLRERWLREDERALLDRVAGAWGFQEKWRRGEEEGEDWEALREWAGLRGMVLDKVELMEGME